MSQFQGSIGADVVEARFAFSGKIEKLFIKSGDNVRKGEIIASLDRTQLQTELDRQLKDYEKVRAEFELYKLKPGQERDDYAKFTREARQAALDVSVKDVELAKYRLDQSDLVSPVNGRILNMRSLREGLSITPASSAIAIGDSDTIRFVFEVSQPDLVQFLSVGRVRIRIDGISKDYTGTTKEPFWGTNGSFSIEVNLDDRSGLLPGMKGIAEKI